MNFLIARLDFVVQIPEQSLLKSLSSLASKISKHHKALAKPFPVQSSVSVNDIVSIGVTASAPKVEQLEKLFENICSFSESSDFGRLYNSKHLIENFDILEEDNDDDDDTNWIED